MKRTDICAFLIILLSFMAGCNPAATATATLPPPEATTASPTHTLTLAPTETPMLTPSATHLLSTVTPSPTPTYTIQPSSTPEPAIQAFEVIEGIAYNANDNPAQTLSIYLPSEENKKPITLLVFGGEGFPELVKHFAELGYPVIAFKARNDSYLTETQDSFCALAWAHANANTYGINGGLIFPVGGSMWGGNAALLGLVDDPAPFLEECIYTLPETNRVAGVITLAGVFDYSEAGDFFDGFIEAVSDYMGGPPTQVPENWAAASAITWVKRDEPPFLLVHGKADTNVSQHQSERFAAALKNVGSEPALVLLPGINHYNSVTASQVFEAMQSFLEKLVGEQLEISQETGQPAEPTTEGVEDLRITIIYDNYLQDQRLTPEWGFAALVEYNQHVLLFDTGGTTTILENMQLLDIDPKRVEAVVLSHAHGDHIGGLLPFLAAANQPTVYLLPSFPNDFKNSVAAITEVVEVRESTEIFPGFYSTGQVSGEVREQGLAIHTHQGTVIITGCAHPGIVRMVRRGRSAVQPGTDVDYDPIALLIGGFHLLLDSQEQVETIIEDLRELDVKQISPTHCTRDQAIALFADAFADAYIQGGAGKTITLP